MTSLITQTDIILFVVAGLLFFIGVVGCIIPGLPGTPLCWGALLCVSFTSVCTVSWTNQTQATSE
ncbi:MAG: hypothetical protein K2J81_05915 [Treponemataceae bacterium]|nr:hypothetical protein [Treponemataceae bacterium]